MHWIARTNLKNVGHLKKAAQAAFAIGQFPQDIHNQLMETHWSNFVSSRDEQELEFALEHIDAYLSSRYKFEHINPISDKISVAAGYQSIDDYFYSNGYVHRNSVRFLTRNSIDTCLGYGHASESRIGISRDKIIDEIINRIFEGKIGVYCYIVFDSIKEKINMCYLIIREKGVYIQDNLGVEYRISNIKDYTGKINHYGEINFSDPDFIEKSVSSSLQLHEPHEDIHKNSMGIYWRFYENFKNKMYLKFALEHIAAYINSGFKSADLDNDLTTNILTAAGYKTINDYLCTLLEKKQIHRVNLSRKRLDSILGVGSARNITREEIIKDICAKVKNNETGTHDYMIYDDKNQEHLKQLVIEKDKSYMKDDLNNIFIFFVN